ncbi:MAG: methyltransferase domain-containing protein, partial [Myxococcota bacterium]
MTATIEPQFRRRTHLGWADFLPRYLLVEAACRGRRVLEVGTQDARSLVRLRDGGAARIVGTTPEPDVVDPGGLLDRKDELLAMEEGRLGFEDDAFDVVLVVDLARQLARDPRFLDEVRRILAADGFALIGFESGGRGLGQVVDDRAPPPLLDAGRLQSAIRAAFADARFFQQTPFVGVAIHPEGNGQAADVAVDPSLAARSAQPSHVIAIAGAGTPGNLGPTLVEIPFLDFEATAQAAHARSA